MAEVKIKLTADTEEATAKISAFDRAQSSAFNKLESEGGGALGRVSGLFDRLQTSAGNAVKWIAGEIFSLHGAVATLVGAGGLGLWISKSMELESRMIGVQKTTDLSNASIAGLQEEFLKLTKTMPITANQLSDIGIVAGQLGIKSKADILKFTETIAKIAAVTNYTASEAATDLARLSNLFHLPIQEVGRLAGVMNALENTTTATAPVIGDFMKRLAPASVQLGLTAADTAALSATLVDLGFQSEMAGTAVSTTFTEMISNSKFFARQSGMSVAEFRHALETDAIGTVLRWAKSIQGLPTADFVKQLNEAGIDGARAMTVFTSLAKSTDLLSKNVNTANQEFLAGSSLQKEFETRLKSTESQWIILKNRIYAAAYEIGSNFLPTVKQVIDQAKTDLNPVLEKAKNLYSANAAEINNMVINGYNKFRDAISWLVPNVASLTKGIYDHRGELVLLGEVLASVWVAGKVNTYAAALAGLPAQLALIRNEVGMINLAMVGPAGLLVGAGLVGVSIGSWLKDLPAVQHAMDNIFDTFTKSSNEIGNINKLTSELPRGIVNAGQALKDASISSDNLKISMGSAGVKKAAADAGFEFDKINKNLEGAAAQAENLSNKIKNDTVISTKALSVETQKLLDEIGKINKKGLEPFFENESSKLKFMIETAKRYGEEYLGLQRLLSREEEKTKKDARDKEIKEYIKHFEAWKKLSYDQMKNDVDLINKLGDERDKFRLTQIKREQDQIEKTIGLEKIGAREKGNLVIAYTNLQEKEYKIRYALLVDERDRELLVENRTDQFKQAIMVDFNNKITALNQDREDKHAALMEIMKKHENEYAKYTISELMRIMAAENTTAKDREDAQKELMTRLQSNQLSYFESFRLGMVENLNAAKSMYEKFYELGQSAHKSLSDSFYNMMGNNKKSWSAMLQDMGNMFVEWLKRLVAERMAAVVLNGLLDISVLQNIPGLNLLAGGNAKGGGGGIGMGLVDAAGNTISGINTANTVAGWLSGAGGASTLGAGSAAFNGITGIGADGLGAGVSAGGFGLGGEALSTSATSIASSVSTFGSSVASFAATAIPYVAAAYGIYSVLKMFGIFGGSSGKGQPGHPNWYKWYGEQWGKYAVDNKIDPGQQMNAFAIDAYKQHHLSADHIKQNAGLIKSGLEAAGLSATQVKEAMAGLYWGIQQIDVVAKGGKEKAFNSAGWDKYNKWMEDPNFKKGVDAISKDIDSIIKKTEEKHKKELAQVEAIGQRLQALYGAQKAWKNSFNANITAMKHAFMTPLQIASELRAQADKIQGRLEKVVDPAKKIDLLVQLRDKEMAYYENQKKHLEDLKGKIEAIGVAIKSLEAQKIGFGGDIAAEITRVQRLAFTPEALLAALKSDVSDWRTKVDSSTGQDRITAMGGYKTSALAYLSQAQTQYGVSAPEFQAAQAETLDALKYIQSAGASEFDQMIGVQREQLFALTGVRDTNQALWMNSNAMTNLQIDTIATLTQIKQDGLDQYAKLIGKEEDQLKELTGLNSKDGNITKAIDALTKKHTEEMTVLQTIQQGILTDLKMTKEQFTSALDAIMQKDYRSRGGDVPPVMPKHADGGIFYSEHIAKIAEGGSAEVVFPLKNGPVTIKGRDERKPFGGSLDTSRLERLIDMLIQTVGSARAGEVKIIVESPDGRKMAEAIIPHILNASSKNVKIINAKGIVN